MKTLSNSQFSATRNPSRTVLLNTHLEVIHFGEKTLELLQYFFSWYNLVNEKKLPERLRRWLYKAFQATLSHPGENELFLCTTFNRHGRILVAIATQSGNSGDISLLLVEDERALAQYKELRQQLTRRQLEMYQHYRDGERDIATIAQKMGISVRTAEGHKMNLRRIVSDI